MLGFAWLLAALLLVVFTPLGVVQVLVVAAACVLGDALLLRLDARAWREQLEWAVVLDTPDDGPVHTGAEVELRVELSGDGARGALLLAPLVPHEAQLLGAGGARVRSFRSAPHAARFRFRILQPGRVRFPGLVVRRRSPLGFFEHARLLVALREVFVIPDVRSVRDSRLARLRGASPRAAAQQQAALLGSGTDFAELRSYRPGDPLGRVDWKATARRTQLLVREYESPRELSLHVLFDASAEMTARTLETEGFARAAELVARLAWVASFAGHALHLQPFDTQPEAPIVSSSGARGVQRLLTQLTELPRRQLLRHAESGASLEEARALARETLRARLARPVHDAELDALLREREEHAPESLTAVLALLADLDPLALAALHARCPECRAERFPDELRCPACGHGDPALAEAGLSAHAASLAALLDAALRRRGREVLVLVLSLQGGQVVPAILKRVVLAARGARKVHVVIPRASAHSEWRPTHPASIPDRAFDVPVLTDMERLAEATRTRNLRLALQDTAVQLHALDDAASLDELVVELLQQEALAG
ncbi:MAG: hypothetical protein DHS20C15_05800 [Planctomycetota bacterium]|nr:MAG: hypothetical protein DHS20C15_05800 [Planctomycetota bacterium]